jgi:tRNA dimethylallyltransferase
MTHNDNAGGPSTGSLPPALVILGPTASGKSALAMDVAERLATLANADINDVEIISIDSAQVYRDMNVGTAKPTSAEQHAIRHHLIDILPPTAAYSAARFREDALRLCAEITARGRVPLLVGGTMLYFKALREGLSSLPQADAGIRATLDVEAAEKGWPALHAELARIDPATAARLQPADSQRIQRALEIFRASGVPMSTHLKAERSTHMPFRLIAIGLEPSDRSVLHRRIEQRFENMIKAGLAEELRHLREKYPLTAEMPSMRTVGYRQAWDFLEGQLDADSFRDRGIYATRQLAKRQLTWLRGMSGVTRFDCLAPELAQLVLEHLLREIDSGGGRHGSQ